MMQQVTLLNAPLVKQPFDTPIRLTKILEKGKPVMYGIGMGDAGLIVQVRDGMQESPPRALASFYTHQPSVFKTLDMALVDSLSAGSASLT